MSDNEEPSTFKDKLMTVYTVGFLGGVAVLYSSDGIWVAMGKALIWPLSATLYFIDKFS